MSDLAVAWPTMTPAERRHAYRARILGTDRNLFRRLLKRLGFEKGPVPPVPQRVARRALVLAAVVARAEIDQPASRDQDPESIRMGLRNLVSKIGIQREFENRELTLLNTPVGRVNAELAIAAAWRAEGLAVLAWALNWFRLPAYDQPLSRSEIAASAGLRNREQCNQLLKSPTLRSPVEIDQIAARATVVTWRLRTFRMSPIPWDFVGHLRRQPAFQEHWITGLELIDNDLAIDGRPIYDAAEEAVARVERIAIERQIAAYWLQGDHVRYSQVDPSTLLSTC